MICQRCKKDSIPDAVYCAYCGKKLSPTKKSRTKSRGNGTGTAFKRGSTWTAQVVVDRIVVAEDKPLRKITRSKGGFKTRDEALRYCPVLKNGPEKPALAPTLAHYWETYQTGAYEALSASKKYSYKYAWNKLEKIHNTRVDQLTVAGLQQLLSSECKDLYYPMKDCKTILLMLFRMAAAEGYANEKIPTFIQLPKLEEKERQPFSETEQAALWKLYEDGDIRAAIPLLLIYTGMMPGEAMQLRVDQIDIGHRQIVGAGMKTKVRKQTPIVIADAIVPLVEDLIAHARNNGYLWHRDPKVWRKDYYDALAAAKCRKLTPYSCRHTTATALAISENIAPQTVKKVMRWSTAKMLDRYAHPDQAAALEAVNTIGASR